MWSYVKSRILLAHRVSVGFAWPDVSSTASYFPWNPIAQVLHVCNALQWRSLVQSRQDVCILCIIISHPCILELSSTWSANVTRIICLDLEGRDEIWGCPGWLLRTQELGWSNVGLEEMVETASQSTSGDQVFCHLHLNKLWEVTEFMICIAI